MGSVYHEVFIDYSRKKYSLAQKIGMRISLFRLTGIIPFKLRKKVAWTHSEEVMLRYIERQDIEIYTSSKIDEDNGILFTSLKKGSFINCIVLPFGLENMCVVERITTIAHELGHYIDFKNHNYDARYLYVEGRPVAQIRQEVEAWRIGITILKLCNVDDDTMNKVREKAIGGLVNYYAMHGYERAYDLAEKSIGEIFDMIAS